MGVSSSMTCVDGCYIYSCSHLRLWLTPMSEPPSHGSGCESTIDTLPCGIGLDRPKSFPSYDGQIYSHCRQWTPSRSFHIKKNYLGYAVLWRRPGFCRLLSGHTEEACYSGRCLVQTRHSLWASDLRCVECTSSVGESLKSQG